MLLNIYIIFFKVVFIKRHILHITPLLENKGIHFFPFFFFLSFFSYMIGTLEKNLYRKVTRYTFPLKIPLRIESGLLEVP